MGIVTSRDTRRLSFDNTLAMNPVLIVQRAGDDGDQDFEYIDQENDVDFDLFKEKKMDIDLKKDHEEMDYWNRRIECLKKEHQVINNILETEYERTIENTRKLYEIPKITPEKLQKVKPCFDWRTKILQCYKENSHQPLACSGLVKAFSDYVASLRMEE